MAIPKSGNNPNRKRTRIPKSNAPKISHDQDDTEDIEQYKQRIAALEAQLAKKREQEQTETEQKTLPTLPAPEAKKKPTKKKAKAPEPALTHEEDASEWEVHPRTGVKYRKIPPAKLDADGLPVATITDDIDLLDFNNSAQQFLAHLQVAPSKEEQRRMRELREQRAAEAQADFDDKWKDYKAPKPKTR